MASDDMDVKPADESSAAGDTGAAQAATALPAVTPQATEDDKDKGSRVDAAKAFFRAMYAGDESVDLSQPIEGGGGRGGTNADGSCRNCAGMEFALKEAEAKATEADSLYRRMAADFDNFRRRMEKQSEESAAAGVRKAVEALLPALDDFDRAKTYLSAEMPSDKLFDAINLVFTRLISSLESTGVKHINSVGEPFDPKYHEPVQQITTTEFPDGYCMQELRGGYMMHDKVIRPAMVNVADNPNGAVVSAPAAAPASAAAAAQTAAETPAAAPAAQSAAEAPASAPAAEPAPAQAPSAPAEEAPAPQAETKEETA
jgi:molecular chaperone GrpE